MRTNNFNKLNNIDFKFLSIIIPARNETQNITVCIDSILNNNYPKDKFEIIVIDDFSEDDTAQKVLSYTSNVKLLKLSEFELNTTNAFKKRAIEIGVQHALGEIIVTTDADCILKTNWLSYINSGFENEKTNALVMPVVFAPLHSVLHFFQALDFTTLQGITASGYELNWHAMCNGANFAYTKKIFEKVDGFKNINQKASGDDMLLLQKINVQFPNTIAYIKHSDVIVTTKPLNTINEFLQQRIRWASKTDSYGKNKMFWILVFVYFYNWLLLISFLASIKIGFVYFLILFISKLIVEFIYLINVTAFFKQQKLLLFFIFFQPIHILYTIVSGSFGAIGKYSWKGRKVQ